MGSAKRGKGVGVGIGLGAGCGFGFGWGFGGTLVGPLGMSVGGGCGVGAGLGWGFGTGLGSWYIPANSAFVENSQPKLFAAIQKVLKMKPGMIKGSQSK